MKSVALAEGGAESVVGVVDDVVEAVAESGPMERAEVDGDEWCELT